MFEKIYAKSILVEMEVCPSCSFIQTKMPFQEEALGRLYADYRSESYNLERTRYEPEYASMAAEVGASDQEIKTRKGGLTRWLAGKLDQEPDFSMLDFGGATGMFLPDLRGSKYVFDISNIAPAAGITKIKEESELGSYSYVQLAHVLEHVPYPLALTAKAASLLKQSGHLYIEVPQDLNEDALNRLANGDKTLRLAVHEHINQYFVPSLTALIRAAGLSIVAVESEQVDLGWTKGTIIHALGRKC